jgi:hypothetical protein
LNLEKNQITGRGVHYMSKIIEKKHKISLKKLILSKNDLSGKEGIHLLKMICENTSIEILAVQDCHLED